MNVMILMAGGDQAFKEAGYHYPKNLIEIDGRPLVEHVVRSFDSLKEDVRFLCLVRKSEIEKNHTASVIKLLVPEAQVIGIPGETAGASCTALWAIDEIDRDEPLLITNGDQILETDYQEVMSTFQGEGVDGGVVVFDGVHPKWSYVKVDANGQVIEAAEKRPISRLATAGTYYFRRGSDFVRAAESMILKGAAVGGIYYVCPSYNEMILNQARIITHQIKRENYFQLKTPRGLQDYEAHLRGAQRN